MRIGFLGAIALRVIHIRNGGETLSTAVFTAGIWVVSYLAWDNDWWKGADAKFIMILVLAFPYHLMPIITLIPNVLVGIYVLIRKYGANMIDWYQVLIERQTLEEAPKSSRLKALPVLSLGWLIWLAASPLLGLI